jgi:hypothetical protein
MRIMVDQERKKTTSLGVEGCTIVVASEEAARVTLLIWYWRKVVERNKGGDVTMMSLMKPGWRRCKGWRRTRRPGAAEDEVNTHFLFSAN